MAKMGNNSHEFINEFTPDKDYTDMLKKYQSMVNSRKELNDINIDNYLPDISDMLKEDCVWDVLKDMSESVNKGNDNKEDIAYYTEKPPIMTPGYYEDSRCFVLRASKFAVDGPGEYELGSIDGDTWAFFLDDLDVGGKFKVNGREFNTYKEYAMSNGLDASKLEIRTVGIDTAEICHYSVAAVYDKSNIKTLTFKEAKIGSKNNSYHFNPYKIQKNNSDNPESWTIEEYSDDEEVKFLKQGDSYFQIMENMTATDYLVDVDINKDVSYYVICGEGKVWGSETIRDGYKAQYRVRELIENSNLKEIITIIDHNTTLGRRSMASHLYYNSFFFVDRNIEALLYDLSKSLKDIDLYNLSFAPFGCDKYGRSLGNTWVRIGTPQGDMWVNVAKYIMAGTEFSINNPSFSGTDMEEIYGGMSSVFKQYMNTSNEGRYVDAIDSNGETSYHDRINLHKELTGIDFTGDARNCTVLIGDCMFMVPPQSIRHSSALDYEKVPILRGKGSMVKNRTNIEEIIELELYFNSEAGINGIPYKTKTPNDTEITYHMNGLRALVAQFKVAPYLPIENHYINDILNIEAVSLINMNIGNVEGFPNLLRVILTLRDFNYRVFMPDLPVPNYDEESDSISKLQPVFAKCFDWELFRYYYQRGIVFGEELATKEYNSFEYGEYLYSHKNSYLPAKLNHSDFEIYVPDVAWLKSALQAKKAKDQYGQFLPDIELKDNEKKWLGKFGNIATLLSDVKDSVNYRYAKATIERMGSPKDLPDIDKLIKLNKNSRTIDNFLSTKETNLKYLDNDNNSYHSAYEYIEKLITPIYDSLRKSPVIKSIIVDEITKNKKVTYKFTCYLSFTEIDSLINIKTVLKDFVGADNTEDIFEKDGTISFDLSLDFKAIQTDGDDNVFYGQHFTGSISDGMSNDYVVAAMKAYGEDGTDYNGVEDNQNEAFSFYNYKDPKNMKFVPYLLDEEGNGVGFEIENISIVMGNVFTETHLKAVDGYAPQFMGGADIGIELDLLITSEYYIGVLKNLPHLALDMIRNYRRVMPCFPIKIKNEYLQLMGVNECLIENVLINTKEGFPGTYEVKIKLASVDRTMRQRESLQKADLDNGQTSSTAGEASIADYFELQKTLSKAELYPDLDLPTVGELKDLGWKFAKWANEERLYVDPDFYVCYSMQYAAKLIKTVVDKIMNKISYNAGIKEAKAVEEDRELTTEEKNSKEKATLINQMRLIDTTGLGADISGGYGFNGVSIDEELGFSHLYDGIMSQIQNSSREEMLSSKKAQKKKEEDKNNLRIMGSAIEYLTASGIENGWQIKPGWYAPICSEYLDKELAKYKYSGLSQETTPNEDSDAFVKEIYDLRNKALTYINKILDKPLNITKDKSPTEGGPGYDSTTDKVMRGINQAVEAVFDTQDGKALLSILAPMGDNKRDIPLKITSESHWDSSNVLSYIKGFLYALACTRSGDEVYGTTKTHGWKPRQWQEYEYEDTDNAAIKAGFKNKKIPYNLVEKSKNAVDLVPATTYDSWHKEGVSFGAGQITKHTIAEIKAMMQPKSKIKYFNKNYNTGDADYYNSVYYKTKKAERNRFCETGFIDQYYNFAGYNSAEGKDYIERISNSIAANMEALLREVLMHLKRMIMEGFFFGEVDIISKDWDSEIEDILGAIDDASRLADTDETKDEKLRTYAAGPAGYQEATKDYSEAIKGAMYGDTNLNYELIDNLREEIPKTYKKLFCSRMIYPFIAAATNADSEFYKLLENRDYASLNTYTLASTIGNSNNSKMNKFLNALYGIKMIGSSDIMESSEITSNTQKAFNMLMSEAFTAMSNDPRCYVLHSMYDMCVNDKRGRLLRAFPCYYVLFVDEGRTIGTWKLFDNFYNMSSINNIQVVKSRKIQADTCTFTMSNMFMSYAETYDNSIYQQYVNAYSVKDVFSSIFTPRGYVEKEDMLRKRKQLMDTQPLSPGIRLHVRMGYGSDASKIPIVFNGKIAEVSCGETVDIVAQGDGHELTNPLNTLGELTARSFQESQSWNTMFKDIRGALARGGETPRNLLAKISTAEYGGAFKTIVREASKGRFFYDNPFGLYHFGDKRFRDIFEDSEIVQNMYEVSDRTILNGVNDLIGDTSTVKVSPIINCNIQDKTMWEIGHLCANTGDDYYFAVRDFGLRSTMCLCRANHYYAYDYDMTNIDKEDTIVEKRKPFQQWHYYDSYNDIIYNSIKASEANMKTNAVGVWEGSDYLWGTGQKSVGPIYLDFNIYPEYQKSMTVDTGLISGGDGGINIPLFSALSEKFNMDEYAGRVNKSLAEKVTTNVLRQSVKDMYEGEMCVIGDTSLKPYDRVTIVDLYEDMAGDVEVETVIHGMNMETGFTTTFIPDLIVRTENASQECGVQSVLSSVITGLTGALTLRGALVASATKSTSGLVKLGQLKKVVSLADKIKKAEQLTSLGKFLATAKTTAEGASLAGGVTSAALLNPVSIAATCIAAGSVFMITANIKEAFLRWCKNIQALSVFPITKNSRMMVAGMAGHRGSVYGYGYNEDSATNPKDSIQYQLMNFLDGDNDKFTTGAVSICFKFLLSDDIYKNTTNKWISNLGLDKTNDIIKSGESGISNAKNMEAFFQNLSDYVSKEYSSKNIALAALKTKPRITKFNTSNRTSEAFLKYQIGGVYDKSKDETDDKTKDENNSIYNYVQAKDLPNNEKIKGLLPIEDEPDIKLALNENVHPVIKLFKFAHSSSQSTFNLKMEHENTVIRYIVDKNKDNKEVYDLPMLQEDALIVLKLIMNEEVMQDKNLQFLSGTRVNSLNSWQSTGFAFSIRSSDMTALETAVKEVKKNSSWINKDTKSIFDYRRTDKGIAITVYAPFVSSNTDNSDKEE